MTAITAESRSAGTRKLPDAEHLVEMFFWLSSILIVIAVRTYSTGVSGETLVALAALGLAHSIRAFWNIGGNSITASGVYMIASGVFGYFPALYTHFGYDLYDVSNGFAILIVLSISQVLMHHLIWHPRHGQRKPVATEAPDYAATSFGFGSGAFLLVAGVVVGRVFELGSTSVAGAVAFTGVLLVAVSIAQAGRRPGPMQILVVIAAFALYVETMFSGGGRLVLGGLAIALALVFSQRAHTRLVKLGTLVALPLGLLALAANRSTLIANTRGTAETGLESVISPYARLGQLIEMAQNGDVPLAFGKTILATLLIFVPRSVWPDKPVGFGAELGDLFRPDLIGTGFSEAALFTGEWVFNLGVAGMVIMVPFTAWAIGWADQWQHRSQARQVRTRHDLFVRASTVLISAGVLDLFWGGTFLFAARGGQRLVILLVIYALFAWHSRLSEQRGMRGPQDTRRNFVSFRP